MGMSNKEFKELVFLMMFVLLYPNFSFYLARTYNLLAGLISLVGPFMIIILYLSFKSGDKK